MCSLADFIRAKVTSQSLFFEELLVTNRSVRGPRALPVSTCVFVLALSGCSDTQVSDEILCKEVQPTRGAARGGAAELQQTVVDACRVAPTPTSTPNNQSAAPAEPANASPSFVGRVEVTNLITTGATLSWNAAQDDTSIAEKLSYRVLLSPDAGRLDTWEEVLAAEHSSPEILVGMDWATGVTSATLGQLAPDTSYALVIIVRDEQGAVAISPVEIFRTAAQTPDASAPASTPTPEPTAVPTPIPDTVAPTVASGSVSASLAGNQMQFSWSAASDDRTPVNALEYRIVKAPQIADLATLELALARAGNDVLEDWQVLPTTVAKPVLPDGNYAFAVLVRDASGNSALVGTSSLEIDRTPPTIADPRIRITRMGTGGIDIAWSAASDNATPANALIYRVYERQSDSPAPARTVAQAMMGGNLVASGTNLTSQNFSLFAFDLGYHFDIVVEDAKGNRSIYRTRGEFFARDQDYYFPFDTEAKDVGKVNTTLTVTDASPASDRFGAANSAYSFNGTSSKIVTAANLVTDYTDGRSRTLSLWVKPEGDNAGKIIAGYGSEVGNDGEDSNFFGIKVTADSIPTLNGKIAFWGFGVSGHVPSTETLGTGWEHLVVAKRFDAITNDEVITIYKNAIQVKQWTVPLLTGTSPLVIGTGPTTTAGDQNAYFQGQIDDVRLFPRELDAAQIHRLHHVTRP